MSIQSLTQTDLEQMQASYKAWSDLCLLTNKARAHFGATSDLIAAFLVDPSDATCSPMIDALVDARTMSEVEAARINDLEKAATAMRIAQALGDPCQWAKDLGSFLAALSETHASMAMECFAGEFAELGEVFRAARAFSPAGLQ